MHKNFRNLWKKENLCIVYSYVPGFKLSKGTTNCQKYGGLDISLFVKVIYGLLKLLVEKYFYFE